MIHIECANVDSTLRDKELLVVEAAKVLSQTLMRERRIEAFVSRRNTVTNPAGVVGSTELPEVEKLFIGYFRFLWDVSFWGCVWAQKKTARLRSAA